MFPFPLLCFHLVYPLHPRYYKQITVFTHFRGFWNDFVVPIGWPPVHRRLTALVVLVSACLTLQAAQLTKPSANDRHVALAVTSLLKHEHLLRHPLDTEISDRCMKTFLQELIR